MFKKGLALICALAMVLSLLACGGGSGSSGGSGNSGGGSGSGSDTKQTQAKTDTGQNSGGGQTAAKDLGEGSDTLNIAYGTDRGTLAPIWGSGSMGACIYDVLYQMDNTPVLAESWEMADDTHMTLHIRQGVKDTAGNPFTAHDVVYSLNYATTDMISSFYVPAIDFEKTKATDDYTVEIVLKQPDVDQWYLLANVFMFTQASMEASEDEMTTHPIGTGPYKIVEYIPNSSVKMEANEDYWGEVPFKYVNWYIISEQTQRAVALESGQVDLAFELSTSDYLRLKETTDYQTLSYTNGNNYVLYFNCSENSISSNLDFRKAIAYAVDSNAVSQVVFGGLAPASTYTYISGAKGVAPSWGGSYYETDMEKAKELLEKAGVSPGTKITIGSQSANLHTATAEVIQGILMELGLNVELVSYEPATWSDVAADPNNGIDIQVDSVGCPDEYFGNAIRSRIVMSKATHYENVELLDLINQSTQTIDPDKQLEINKKMNDLVTENVPFYSMVDDVFMLAYDSGVSGVEEMMAHDKKLLHLTWLHP